MLVTVAICTWNRAALLDQTLARMRELRIPDGHTWELLVVNNNSTDNTDEVIDKHSDHLPVQRLLETRQGLSNARNRVLTHTRGDLLLWTDDDVLVDPDWLVSYVETANSNPNAGYFGGTVEPWFETEPPRWVNRNLDLLQGPFALRNLGNGIRPFVDRETPFGANMAFRTAELRGFEFDPRLGRVGTGMLSGDETSLIDRLKAEGRTGIWIGPAKVRHFIPTVRMTSEYIWKFFHGLGRTRQLLSPYNRDVPLVGSGPRWIWRRYLFARAKALLATPTRGRWWLMNYIDAAVHRGILDECRCSGLVNVTLSPQPSLPRTEGVVGRGHTEDSVCPR
jgi:glycosyltransferase involved in cell wall biosynthesis